MSTVHPADKLKQTLSLMSAFARGTEGSEHPAIIKLARRIVVAANVRPRDYKGEAFALLRFVQRRVRFTRDPRFNEMVQTPVTSLLLGTGDCDDSSTLLAALLLACGHKPYFCVVDVTGDGYSHVYIVEYIKGQRVPMDPSDRNIRPGTEVKSVARFEKEV